MGLLFCVAEEEIQVVFDGDDILASRLMETSAAQHEVKPRSGRLSHELSLVILESSFAQQLSSEVAISIILVALITVPVLLLFVFLCCVVILLQKHYFFLFFFYFLPLKPVCYLIDSLRYVCVLYTYNLPTFLTHCYPVIFA